MVLPESFDVLRQVNFGYASMQNRVTAESLGREIDRYDPGAAKEVTKRVRGEARMKEALDKLEEVYAEASRYGVPDFDPLDAASDLLRLQALLARAYLSGLKPAKGKALQLPTEPLPGNADLVAFLADFLQAHDKPDDRVENWRQRARELREQLEAEKAKSGAEAGSGRRSLWRKLLRSR